jgi:hypothetical protein
LVINDKKVKYTDLIAFKDEHIIEFNKFYLDIKVYRIYGKFRMVKTSKKGFRTILEPLNYLDQLDKHFITNTQGLPTYNIQLSNKKEIIKPNICLKNNSVDIPVGTRTKEAEVSINFTSVDPEILILLFKSSKYCNDALQYSHLNNDQSVALKGLQPYLCVVCHRQHTKNSNHPVIFSNENGVWFMCRQTHKPVFLGQSCETAIGKNLLPSADLIDESEKSSLGHLTVTKKKMVLKPDPPLTKLDHVYVMSSAMMTTRFNPKTKKNEEVFNIDKLVKYMNKYLMVVTWTATPSVIELDYTNNKQPYLLRSLQNSQSRWVTIKDAYKMWITNPQRREVSTPIWRPYTKVPPQLEKDEFNLFWSLKHKVDPKIFMQDPKPICPEIEPMLQHINDVWANNDPKVFEYLISWFAHKVQYPEIKLTTAIVLKSLLHGSGKNIVVDYFTEHVIGEESCRTIDDLKNLLTNFNSDSERSLLVCLDEIHQSGLYSHSDVVKSLITRKRQRLENKGLDSRWVPDYNSYIMFSNNDFIVKIESSDRRYLCLEASNKYAGNTKYFNHLGDICMNDLSGQKMFEYLLTYDISKFKPTILPITEWKRSLREKSMPPMIQSIINLINNNLESTETNWFVSEFMDEYDLLIKDKKKYILTPTNFSKGIQKILQLETNRCLKNKQRKSGFAVSIHELKDKMKILLKDPELVFKKLEDVDLELNDDYEEVIEIENENENENESLSR